MTRNIHLGKVAILSAVAAISLSATPQRVEAAAHYTQVNLVSDIVGMAPITDPNLKNPWGISFSPTGPLWISDNNSGKTTVYDGFGNPFPTGSPLVVTIPPPLGAVGAGTPTGQFFNGNSNEFVVTKGNTSGAAVFVFDSEDGTISGWSPSVDFANAVVAVDNSSNGAVYKGITWATWNGADYLYATDFHNNKVDIYDSSFHWVSSFTDNELPAGYAPFNVESFDGRLYVTFAKQDEPDHHDDVAGPGNGFIDVFTTGGVRVRRLISRGALNAPWGLTVAPAGFGQFSGALLVGNFGDGRINAYNKRNGRFLGTLTDANGAPIWIDGLWGLKFGNGAKAGPANWLYFTAGINGEADGLLGYIVSN